MDASYDPDIRFFQLVEDLQRQRPDAPPVGSTASPLTEAIRFRANRTLAFPASEVARVAPDATRDDLVDVSLNLIGLYGPSSPLPTIFTERVLDPETGSAVADFLDIFNHRFAGLLFLVWKHYRHDLRYAAGGTDALSLAVGSLFGMPPQSEASLDRERLLLLPYAGLLAMGSRSAVSVSRILGHCLGLACRIEEFVPRRVVLPPEARFVLGGSLELGIETLLGEATDDIAGHCRISLGPMSFERYLALLPDGPESATLQHLIDMLISEPLSRDCLLVIEEGGVPDWSLGSGRLGWTTWADAPRSGCVEASIPSHSPEAARLGTER